MVDQPEVDFCHNRETQERAAACRASDPAVRASHFMMAERYADKAWSLTEGDISLPPAA